MRTISECSKVLSNKLEACLEVPREDSSSHSESRDENLDK